VIVPDTVVVYRIFGLSLDAIFALARLVTTPIIIFYAPDSLQEKVSLDSVHNSSAAGFLEILTYY